MEAFSSNVRHFMNNFEESVWLKASYNKKSEAFSKISRFFVDIFNRVEPFFK
jgi:hypothetical protein